METGKEKDNDFINSEWGLLRGSVYKSEAYDNIVTRRYSNIRLREHLPLAIFLVFWTEVKTDFWCVLLKFSFTSDFALMVFAKASHLNKPDTKDKININSQAWVSQVVWPNIMPMWQEYINNYSAWHNVFKPHLPLKQTNKQTN